MTSDMFIICVCVLFIFCLIFFKRQEKKGIRLGRWGIEKDLGVRGGKHYAQNILHENFSIKNKREIQKLLIMLKSGQTVIFNTII